MGLRIILILIGNTKRSNIKINLELAMKKNILNNHLSILLIAFIFASCNTKTTSESLKSDNSIETKIDSTITPKLDVEKNIDVNPTEIYSDYKKDIKDLCEEFAIVYYDLEIEDQFIRITVDETGITNGDNVASLFCNYAISHGMRGKMIVLRNLKQESIGRSICR